MSGIKWANAVTRHGIDRGVLYLSDGRAVPWNGLVSVTETLDREVKSYYIDGVKYLDYHVPGSYAGKLRPTHTPTSWRRWWAIGNSFPGVVLHDQRVKLFNLSYRTKVGSDLDEDLGYKVHILYNVTINSGDFGHDSLGAGSSAKPFEWNLSTLRRDTLKVELPVISLWILDIWTTPSCSLWSTCSTDIPPAIRNCSACKTFWIS